MAHTAPLPQPQVAPASTALAALLMASSPAGAPLPDDALRAHGLSTQLAHSRDEVLDLLRGMPGIALLVLELSQPGAMELAEAAMRMRDETLALEIILVADAITPAEAARAMRSHVTDLLPCRCDARTATAAAEHALRRAAARRAQAAHARASQIEIAFLRQNLAEASDRLARLAPTLPAPANPAPTLPGSLAGLLRIGARPEQPDAIHPIDLPQMLEELLPRHAERLRDVLLDRSGLAPMRVAAHPAAIAQALEHVLDMLGALAIAGQVLALRVSRAPDGQPGWVALEFRLSGAAGRAGAMPPAPLLRLSLARRLLEQEGGHLDEPAAAGRDLLLRISFDV